MASLSSAARRRKTPSVNLVKDEVAAINNHSGQGGSLMGNNVNVMLVSVARVHSLLPCRSLL